jgi:hypothetical protein
MLMKARNLFQRAGITQYSLWQHCQKKKKPKTAKLVMRVQKELLLLLHVFNIFFCNKQSPTQIQAVHKSLPFFLTRWSPDDQRDINQTHLDYCMLVFWRLLTLPGHTFFSRNCRTKTFAEWWRRRRRRTRRRDFTLNTTTRSPKLPREFLQIVKDVVNPK